MILKKLNNLVNRIPDFYEDSSNPGRRDAMKGMTALTAGTLSLLLSASTNNEDISNVALSVACAGGGLFLGYVGKSVYRTIKYELSKGF